MRKSWRSSLQTTVNRPQSTVFELPCTVDSRLLAIILLALLISCTSKKSAETDTYTCPMHPTVVSDKHGTCPVCGMDLVRKSRAGEEVEITEDLAQLLQSPDEVIISNIATIKGKYQLLPTTTEAQGIITYDTRYASTISARVAGRLENAGIKFPFQQISKGQKIAEIYSPELITAQRELIYLLQKDADNTLLLGAAKQKLALLGFTSSQLNLLINKKEITSTTSIYSDIDGYVINETQVIAPVLPSATMNTGGMNSSTENSKSTASNETNLIRSGDYVNAGQTLFKIVSTSALRVELSLPSTQASTIKVNDQVTFQVDGSSHQGKVDLIQPFNQNNDELVRIRIYLTDKNNNFRIGQLVNVSIQTKASEGLWVPAAAVLDLGLKQVVFIKDRGVFKAKEIKTGSTSKDWIEVKGIASTDEIASDAHYLADSENLIKTLN